MSKFVKVKGSGVEFYVNTDHIHSIWPSPSGGSHLNMVNGDIHWIDEESTQRLIGTINPRIPLGVLIDG